MDAGKIFLTEFIDCYKLCQSLWDNTTPDYTSRQTKLTAYNQLLKIMQKYKKDASVDDVKKKINTLRSNFRREMNRVQKSEQRGDDPLYTPNLWWFEKINFLSNLKNSKQKTIYTTETAPKNKTDNEEAYADEYLLQNEGDEEEDEEEDNDPVCKLMDTKLKDCTARRYSEETYVEPKPKKFKNHEENNLPMNSYLLPSTSAILSSGGDGGDTIDHMCRAWAGNLREMDKHQRILAGRAISEIIFQGQVGVLTFDSIPKMPAISSQMATNHNNTTLLSEDPVEYKMEFDNHQQSTPLISSATTTPTPTTSHQIKYLPSISSQAQMPANFTTTLMEHQPLPKQEPFYNQ